MEVNMTLIIQGVNFFLAYLVLDKILLRPLVVLIQKNKIEREARFHCIFGLEESVSQQTKYKIVQWAAYQKDFVKKIPGVPDKYKKQRALLKQLHIESLDENESALMCNKVKEAIIKKVLHVDV